MTHRPLTHAVRAALLCAAPLAWAQVEDADWNEPDPSVSLADAEHAPYDFSDERLCEVSGITYLGGDRYVMVSDQGGVLAEATITIDRETGAITGVAFDELHTIEGGRDLEDVAYDEQDQVLLIVDEATQTLSRHGLENYTRSGSFNPELSLVYDNARPNLGLESVAVPLGDGLIWTINEEALRGSPRASETRGATLLLQGIRRSGMLARRWAYETDPHTGADNLLERAQCGVSALLALPDGLLVVLERTLGGSGIPRFRNRLYLVDTNTIMWNDSAIPVLDKRLLIEINAGLANYEGLTLGPRLDNGDIVVLLVSDDGGGGVNPQQLLVLRLSGVAIEGGRW